LLTATPLADAEKLGVDFATKAGAKSLKDLRALSTFELYQKYRAQNAGFRTTLDGYFSQKLLPKFLNQNNKQWYHLC
jgi:para-nitrobenzyl esterase